MNKLQGKKKGIGEINGLTEIPCHLATLSQFGLIRGYAEQQVSSGDTELSICRL